MDSQSLNELLKQVVIDTLRTMANLEFETLDRLPDSAFHNPGFAGQVHILGDWHGTVTLQCSEALGPRLAEVMLPQVLPTQDMMTDLIRELTNMIGGNLKAQLGTRCILSTPKAASVTTPQPLPPETSDIASIFFSCEGELLLVRILESTLDLGSELAELPD